jgi:prepilin-type N-terminal cleavage/methylation domain-containing protein
MLNKYLKAFTLVEMLVALIVSSIILIASYASYDLVATQYRKNLDIADMHTSGRAIIRIIERDIRMAGFEYRDKDAKVTYGNISNPLIIKDSGNKCCDEVTVVYDYAQDLLSWKGKLISSKVDRIRIRYWAEPYTSNKGSRYRLYKQKDILGQNKKILPNPKLGKKKEVMADYIEDFQLTKNDKFDGKLYIGGENTTRLIALNPDTMKKVSEHTLPIRFGDMTFSVNTSGKIPMTVLVSINLTLRTKNQYGKDKQFKKKDYHVGNYKFDKTDKYKRDTFSSTVLVRNLAL